MRVSGERDPARRGVDAAATRACGRFAELLRRHAAGPGDRPAGGGRAGAADGPGTAAASAGTDAGTRGEAVAHGRRAPTARGGRGPAGLEPAAEAAAAPVGRGVAPSGPLPPAGPPPPVEPARATLALAVRAVVPAVKAFRLGGREALTLDFGRALGVELRQRPGGVELSLTAAAALAPAARAELPGLLRALAARGVPVLRAEVRERGRPPDRR